MSVPSTKQLQAVELLLYAMAYLRMNREKQEELAGVIKETKARFDAMDKDVRKWACDVVKHGFKNLGGYSYRLRDNADTDYHTFATKDLLDAMDHEDSIKSRKNDLLTEALDEHDDVQNVYANFDIDEKEMEALAR